MQKTKISWAVHSWNPVTGCDPMSPGCKNCYARNLAERLKGNFVKKYANGFKVTLHPDSLKDPLDIKKPSRIFVCSMSDLFHKAVPFEFIDEVMKVIVSCAKHSFLILTKRADRMADYFSNREVEVPENAWLGVTVEAQSTRFRIDLLRTIPAKVKFLSCEPLLEDLGELDLAGINWVIVGGESGLKARPMEEEWALNILSQAEAQGVKRFFKQWGTYGSDGIKRSPTKNGCLINGKLIQELPD